MCSINIFWICLSHFQIEKLILVIVYIGACLSLVNIKTILKEEDFPADKAEELGIYLGIKPGRNSTLKRNNLGNADEMLSAILSEWLNDDGEKSWKKLADALRYLGHSSMADKLMEKKTIPLGGMHCITYLMGGTVEVVLIS